MTDHLTSKELLKRLDEAFAWAIAYGESVNDLELPKFKEMRKALTEEIQSLANRAALGPLAKGVSPFSKRAAMVECAGGKAAPRLEITFKSVDDMHAASDFIRALPEMLKQNAEIARLRAPSEPELSIPEKYHELLLAVESRFPGESRHNTALRYIRQAERRDSVAAQTKSASECGACDKPGEHCANVHGICSRHGGRAHETSDCPHVGCTVAGKHTHETNGPQQP